jgi:hypothetical protein
MKTKEAVKHTPERYLTDSRLQSIKAYLSDVNSGMDTVAAWEKHKRRIDAYHIPAEMCRQCDATRAAILRATGGK